MSVFAVVSFVLCSYYSPTMSFVLVSVIRGIHMEELGWLVGWVGGWGGGLVPSPGLYHHQTAYAPRAESSVVVTSLPPRLPECGQATAV